MFDIKPDEQAARSVGGFLTLSNVRDLSVVALIFVVGVRFATADFNIDLKDFSFTDLVSLFLAISSVALSALFYFKADESSRTFYTHTYKFTKEVSEMLGRIDSGFGEKLANLGQGYNNLNQKFDRFSVDPTLSASRAETSEAKKAEIEEQEARLQDVIEGLMQRAAVDGAEKEELLEKLSTLTRELEQSKAELSHQKTIINSEIDQDFLTFLGGFIAKYFPANFRNAPYEFYVSKFGNVLSDPIFSDAAKGYMRKHGLLFGDILTEDGVALVRSIVKKINGS